jgi:hypothetical protein
VWCIPDVRQFGLNLAYCLADIASVTKIGNLCWLKRLHADCQRASSLAGLGDGRLIEVAGVVRTIVTTETRSGSLGNHPARAHPHPLTVPYLFKGDYL